MLLRKLVEDNKEFKIFMHQQQQQESAKKFKRKAPPSHDESQFHRDMETAIDASRMEAGLSCSSKAGSRSSGSAMGDHDAMLEEGDGHEEELSGMETEEPNSKETEEPDSKETGEPDSKETEKPDSKETDQAPIISSTTHRKEYMALSRKMESIDVTKFPEMSQMWGASKEETWFFE